MSKELWFSIYEEALGDGASEEEAIAKAERELPDRLADLIDQARDQWKYRDL
jgi:hypothetical protein